MPAQSSFQVYLWVFGSGLFLGLIFAFMAWNNARLARKERDRFKRMLGEKLELEADNSSKIKGDMEALRKQNENLRIKVAELNQAPEKRLQRELEIYTRAEKRMVEKSPGFPAAWEAVRREAHDEISLEEAGQTLPRRLFQKFTALTPPVRPLEDEK